MEQSGAHDVHHPSPRKYIVVGAILAFVTALEVAAFYLYLWNVTSAMIAGILLVTSAFKFFLVLAYFMHLKFDDLRFTLLFAFPFVIAIFVMIVLMALFGTLTR